MFLVKLVKNQPEIVLLNTHEVLEENYLQFPTIIIHDSLPLVNNTKWFSPNFLKILK